VILFAALLKFAIFQSGFVAEGFQKSCGEIVNISRKKTKRKHNFCRERILNISAIGK
jgi:hypothetical protein